MQSILQHIELYIMTFDKCHCVYVCRQAFLSKGTNDRKFLTREQEQKPSSQRGFSVHPKHQQSSILILGDARADAYKGSSFLSNMVSVSLVEMAERTLEMEVEREQQRWV